MFYRVTDIDKLIEVQNRASVFRPWSKEELNYSRRNVYLDYIYIQRNIWPIFWIYFLAKLGLFWIIFLCLMESNLFWFILKYKGGEWIKVRNKKKLNEI